MLAKPYSLQRLSQALIPQLQGSTAGCCPALWFDLAEEAKQMQEDDDDDGYTGQPEDDIAQHAQLRRLMAKLNRAGIELSRWLPPLRPAHHAAASEMIKLAAVTNPVRMAPRLALSAASRAAVTASATRFSASCCDRPARSGPGRPDLELTSHRPRSISPGCARSPPAPHHCPYLTLPDGKR